MGLIIAIENGHQYGHVGSFIAGMVRLRKKGIDIEIAEMVK